MPITGLNCLEAVAVLLNINNKSILFVSAYQPPSRKMRIANYNKVMSLHNQIIISGDLMQSTLIGAVVSLTQTASNFKPLFLILHTQYLHQMNPPTSRRTLIDYQTF